MAILTLKLSDIPETLIKKVMLAWAWLFMASLMTGAYAAVNAPQPYKDGLNYIPVMPAQPLDVNPGQIEVIEFFWYGSPQCFALEPYLQTWNKNKPGNVVLLRVPAALNPEWDLMARAYYTAQQLKLGDKANAAIYTAIHVNHRVLATEADFQNLFTGQLGIEANHFQSIWNSQAVNDLIAQAKVLAQRYGITKVPAFAINGKWLTGTGFHLDDARIIGAVNWLTQREESDLPAGMP